MSLDAAFRRRKNHLAAEVEEGGVDNAAAGAV